MKRHFIATVCGLVVVLLQFILTVESTSPAFLWSSHVDDMSRAVNYQTISPTDLAKSILSEGGWSDLLCAGTSSPHPIDVALVFVGEEFSGADANLFPKSSLVDLLKASFTRSNFSMAFPYLAVTDKNGSMGDLLLTEFEEICEHGIGVDNIILTGSCSANGKGYKVAELDSIYDYLSATTAKESKGVRNLIVYCHGSSDPSTGLNRPYSESDVFTNVISSMDQAGLKYTALYVSDPYNSVEHPSRRHTQRFLVQGSYGNASSNSTCDGVCQIKTSLLEGIFTGLVLLLILISGLCCMMGIDTPTRFEAAQDS